MHLVYPPPPPRPDERQSLKRKENERKLLLLGDKLAKPPFFVAYSRLCRHCRNLAEEGCRYFLGHVACRNLPWQGLYHRCQFFKTMSPQRSSFCSLHPRRPKWVMLFSHTVFNRACGEVNPSTFLLKRISISSSWTVVVAFGLFPSPCRLSYFCFAVNASLVLLFLFWKLLYLKIVLR